MSRRDRFDQTPEDKFIIGAYQLFDWVGRHRAVCIAAAAAAAAAVLAVFAYLNHLRSYNENAAAALEGARTAEELKAVTDAYPGSSVEPLALFRRGRKLADEGRYAEAEEAFSALTRSYPGHYLAPDALVFAGMLCVQQEHYEAAVKQYRAVAEKHRGSFAAPRALLGLGACYEAMHRPGDAKVAYEKVIAEYESSDLKKDAEARIARLAQSVPPALHAGGKREAEGEGGQRIPAE